MWWMQFRKPAEPKRISEMEIDECMECLSSDIVVEEVGTKPKCITQHPGFSQVCLQKWSLQLAADKYKTKNKTRYRQTGSENR